MKICPSCSLHNADTAAFCIQCGFALGRVTSLPDDVASGATERSPHSNVLPAGDRPSAFDPSRVDPAGHLANGTLIDGKYAIEKILGEGGMGVVYLARDIHTETHVVVKSIRAEFAHNPEFRARILAEGRVLARIDHSNVVRLNAIVLERGELFLIMQFIEGESLDQMILRHVQAGVLVPVPEALRIFRMILAGVSAAHQEGVIHRDLKPANILLRAKDGVAKVTDFGIAKGEADAKAGRGQTLGIIGSLSYMAPEQVRGTRDLDKRVDIYALGILLFELLIGRVPFEAESDYELMKLHTEAPLPSVRQLRTDVPAAIDGILSRACAKNRDDRFASCEQFIAAFEPASPRAGSDHGADDPFAASAIASRSAWQVPGAGLGAEAGLRGGTAPDPVWGRPSLPLATQIAPYGAPPGGTHEGASLPPAVAARPARTALWVGVLAIALAGTGVGLFESGWLSPRHRSGSSRRVDGGSGPDADSATAASGGTASRAADAATVVRSPLAQLVGPWKSDSLRDYDAVLLDDVIEFRIVHAAQHPGQGYRDGEARFALRAIAGDEHSFSVEDRIRPVPPKGYEYDETRSRGTCQAAWSAVDGRPLRARFDGKTLAVDLVKIETQLSRFVVEAGNKISGCQRLRDAPAEKISSMLTRSLPR